MQGFKELLYLVRIYGFGDISGLDISERECEVISIGISVWWFASFSSIPVWQEGKIIAALLKNCMIK